MTGRILIARGGDAGERLAAAVRQRGGDPWIAPLIEQVPPEDPAALTAAVERWNTGAYDWMVVTSANGAAAVADAGADSVPSAGIAAVGPATARALARRGLEVALTPDAAFSAAGLAPALLDAFGETPRRVLLPVSEIAGTTLERALHDAGHAVDRVTAYRTVPAPENAEAAAAVRAGEVAAILVSSGSIAREVARRFPALPPETRLVAIGPPTAEALGAAGLRADAVADPHTGDGMVAALAGLGLVHPSATHAPDTEEPS